MKIISIRLNSRFVHYIKPTEGRYLKMIKDNLINIGDGIYSDLGLPFIWAIFLEINKKEIKNNGFNHRK